MSRTLLIVVIAKSQDHLHLLTRTSAQIFKIGYSAARLAIVLGLIKNCNQSRTG
jgi:hypothetical protein